MVTIILLIALLILTAGLAVEIGIASWNIHRAGRYMRQKEAAEGQAVLMKDRVDQLTERFRLLDKYATNISWLLKFIYNRYDKFVDIDKELEEGAKEEPAEEFDKKFQDLKRAIKLIKTSIRAHDKIEEFMGSIATQISSIISDLEDADEEEESAEKKDGGQDNNASPNSAEAPAPSAEPAKAQE